MRLDLRLSSSAVPCSRSGRDSRNTGVTSSPGYELGRGGSSRLSNFLSVRSRLLTLPCFPVALSKLPYKTTRCFQRHVPNGQTHIDMNIVENSKDAEKVIVAMRPQSKASGYTTADVNGSTDDAFALRGGENSGSVISKYQFRYGTEQFPPAPVEVRDNAGTTPAILHGLASCDTCSITALVCAPSMLMDALVLRTTISSLLGVLRPAMTLLKTSLALPSAALPLSSSSTSLLSTDLSMFAFVRSNYHLNIGSTGSVRMTGVLMCAEISCIPSTSPFFVRAKTRTYPIVHHGSRARAALPPKPSSSLSRSRRSDSRFVLLGEDLYSMAASDTAAGGGHEPDEFFVALVEPRRVRARPNPNARPIYPHRSLFPPACPRGRSRRVAPVVFCSPAAPPPPPALAASFTGCRQYALAGEPGDAVLVDGAVEVAGGRRRR